jgi:WhiB family transcriptional regulator, redox-sensing transcriptional regulator
MRHEGALLDMLESTGRPRWHRDALCKERPDVNFFPSRGEDPRAAQRVCQSCLVRQECLAWSLQQTYLLQGVWGGLSQQLRLKGLRGRVPDEPAA